MEEVLCVARAIWFAVFAAFMVVTFYMHFRLRSFNWQILFDPEHEDHRLQRRVFLVFCAILVSGLALFAGDRSGVVR